MAALELMESVRKKLALYGYKDVDSYSLESSIDAAIQAIFNFCNIKELPPELNYAVVNMACGEVMYGLSFSNGDTDSESAQSVASIKEGDTQVNFVAEATPTQIKDILIQSLRTLPYDDLIAFRRLRW